MSKSPRKRTSPLNGTVPVPAVTRGGGRSVWGDRRAEPDLEKYARTIVDLAMNLAKADKTLEQHRGEMAKHEGLREKLRKKRQAIGAGDPLPGCACLNCEKRRLSQMRGEKFPVPPIALKRRRPVDGDAPEKK